MVEVLHQSGLDQWARVNTKVTGLDCGCKKRQEWLNRMFPGKPVILTGEVSKQRSVPMKVQTDLKAGQGILINLPQELIDAARKLHLIA